MDKNVESSSILVSPFLKWAGGKRWLSAALKETIDFEYGSYIEPFLGSGAIYFALNPRKAVLSDANPRLINVYLALRDAPKQVTSYLHWFAEQHSDEFYYQVRKKTYRSSSKAAAHFLYLNRTCWNGLYRENLRGEFNVPRGTKNTVIFENEDFDLISKKLSNADISSNDFSNSLAQACEGDVVFVDPPYTVKHNMNGFVKYNQHIFQWDDQVRLKDACNKAADRGAVVIMTNADHESIRQLHQSSDAICSVPRKSVISGSNEGRGQTTEAIIVYDRTKRDWRKRIESMGISAQ